MQLGNLQLKHLVILLWMSLLSILSVSKPLALQSKKNRNCSSKIARCIQSRCFCSCFISYFPISYLSVQFVVFHISFGDTLIHSNTDTVYGIRRLSSLSAFCKADQPRLVLCECAKQSRNFYSYLFIADGCHKLHRAICTMIIYAYCTRYQRINLSRYALCIWTLFIAPFRYLTIALPALNIVRVIKNKGLISEQC